MEIRQLEPQVAAVKRVKTDAVDLPGVIDKGFPGLSGELSSKGVEVTGPPFVRYLQTGEQMEIELGIPIAADSSPATKSIVLPPGPAGVYLYVGTYDGLPAAWDLFRQWLQRQGYTQTGPFWESYVSDPRYTEPAERITELYVPVE
ncbi:MAG TPA: GyrI-like domain-containing protein [Baekduia sp.]|nr:GyrI-like domain-containing protein [Baekduia sp.]